jgi:KDO2-lipid IV(A) lauroyltransferase
VKPVLAPFFGRTARCDRSAGVLIRRVARPLLFGACYRLPGPSLRFRLELGPVLEPGALRDLSAEALAARINAEFERMIAAQPEQYFWLHDRYRDAPPDGSAPSS